MELAFELALNKLHVNRKYVHVYHIDMIKFADTNYVTCHYIYIYFILYVHVCGQYRRMKFHPPYIKKTGDLYVGMLAINVDITIFC